MGLDWGRWKQLPETKELLKQIQRGLQEITPSLGRTADETHSIVSQQLGRRAAFEEVFSIIRENVEATKNE